MKIALLHPSRGRAKQAFEAKNNWLNKAYGNHEIQHIFSIDSDDKEKSIYHDAWKNEGCKSTIIEGNNTCVVEATNRVLEFVKKDTDILIYLSDDFKCPDNWDELIVDRIKDEPSDSKWLLKVHDGLQKFHVDVLTIPIMSKSLADELGYFWHPRYRSMFVDQDLYWTVKLHFKMILAEDLLFEHHHYCNNKAELDETYQRSSNNWNHGKMVYAERKRAGFPLD